MSWGYFSIFGLNLNVLSGLTYYSLATKTVKLWELVWDEMFRFYICFSQTLFSTERTPEARYISPPQSHLERLFPKLVGWASQFECRYSISLIVLRHRLVNWGCRFSAKTYSWFVCELYVPRILMKWNTYATFWSRNVSQTEWYTKEDRTFLSPILWISTAPFCEVSF